MYRSALHRRVVPELCHRRWSKTQSSSHKHGCPLTNFGWPAVLHNNLKGVGPLRRQLDIVFDRALDTEPIPGGIGLAVSARGEESAGF